MLARARWRFRHPKAAIIAVVAVVVALSVVALSAVMADGWNKDKPMPIQGNVASAITTELTTVARTRVFFGHQSVGMNVLDAVPGVYADHGVSAPPIEQGGTQPGPNGGFIAHQYIGVNGKPLLKLEDFDRTMRGGMGRQVDVALMNIDVDSSMDVDALFARYRDTMGALERDFPNVTFIHVTVPLKTEATSEADNVARERMSALFRREYAGHHLYDIAKIESTKPDGTRVSGSYDNQGYFALYDAYTVGDGLAVHLNAGGSMIAATAFLDAIAQASRK
jgi:hypothetical protein